MGLLLRLIWRDTPPKPVKEEAEMSNGVKNVILSEEVGVKTEAKDAEKPAENEDGLAPPRAPTPVFHSCS